MPNNKSYKENLQRIKDDTKTNPLAALNLAHEHETYYKKQPDFCIAYARALMAAINNGDIKKPIEIKIVTGRVPSGDLLDLVEGLLQEAIKISPNRKNEEAAILLADIFLGKANYSRILKQIAEIHKNEKSPFREDAFEILSRALFELGKHPDKEATGIKKSESDRYRESIDITEEGLTLYPANIILLRSKIINAIILDNQGDKKRDWQKVTYDALDALLTLDPKDEVGLGFYKKFAQKYGEWNAPAVGKDNAGEVSYLISKGINPKDMDDAINFAESKMYLYHNNPLFVHTLALAYIFRGNERPDLNEADHLRAEELLQRTIILEPNNQERVDWVHTNQAEIALQKNDCNKAIELLEPICKTSNEPHSRVLTILCMAYRGEGNNYIELGQEGIGIAFLEKAFATALWSKEFYPERIEGYDQSTNILRELGRNIDAKAMAAEMVERFPEDVSAKRYYQELSEQTADTPASGSDKAPETPCDNSSLFATRFSRSRVPTAMGY
jgi:tetratricopeptide (TPR) repeat protein